MTAVTTSASTRPTTGERWRQLPRRWRACLLILAGLVVLYFATSLVAGIYQSPSGAETGPSSSVDASSVGTQAMAQLLSERHHPVQSLTTPLAHATLPVDGTLFVLDPVTSLSPSIGALQRYLTVGGRLVLSGQIANSVLRGLLGPTRAPVWRAAPSGNARPVANTPEDAGVGTVLGGPTGSWQLRRASNVSVLLRGAGGPLALQAAVGRGTVVLLASSTALQNSQLAVADDAAFALDLAGPAHAPAAFDEYDHGLGRSGTGLAGLPSHWKVGLLLGLLAALVWMWSAARRFGPPQRADRELIPARVVHVDAMAGLLASGNTERLAAGAAPLRERGRVTLRRLLHAEPTATDVQLAEIAASGVAPSVTPEMVVALLSTPRSEDDVIAEGRAFVALRPEAG